MPQTYDEIELLMSQWRKGWTALPEAYIKYHKTLAIIALNKLREEGFIIHSTNLEAAGDFDGMQLVTAIVERHYKLAKLRWYDSHATGEWFIRCDSGGWARFDEKTRNEWKG